MTKSGRHYICSVQQHGFLQNAKYKNKQECLWNPLFSNQANLVHDETERFYSGSFNFIPVKSSSGVEQVV